MNKITPIAAAALCALSAPAWALAVAPPNYGVASVAATATYNPSSGFSFTQEQYSPYPGAAAGIGVNDGGGATASAWTDYGANHASASYTAGDGTSLASLGASLWFDQITITGGSGTGTATFHATLDGTVTAGGPDGAAAYVLGVSTINPATLALGMASPTLPLDLSSTQITPVASYLVGTSGAQSACLLQLGGTCPLFNQVVNGGTIAVNAPLSGSVTFTYGQPFYLLGVLGTGAGENFSATIGSTTTLDFSHTGLLNQIVLPQGAILTDASGAPYTVAAVPEPGQWAMLLAGLGLLGMAVRRRART